MSQTMNEDLNVIANSDLEITYLDGDLSIIQQLDDEPNDVGGLTSAQLKAKFDQAGLAIQSYLNNTLIPELLAADATEAAREAAEAGRQAAEQARVTAEAARAAAEQERVNTTSGIVAQATQKANEAAASAVRAEQVALGNIPDGSLAKAKLVPEVQNALDRAAQGGEIDITLANNDPRQWGLGTDAVEATDHDANNINTSGLFIAYLNCPIDGVGWWLIRSEKSSSDKYQWAIHYRNSGGYSVDIIAFRSCVAGVYQPWEFLTPPMLLGVEYRTTERYLGKPVYAYAFLFDAMPSANSYAARSVPCKNVEAVIDCRAIDNTIGTFYPRRSFESATDKPLTMFSAIPNGTEKIYVLCTTDSEDFSGHSATVLLKYIKTTD